MYVRVYVSVHVCMCVRVCAYLCVCDVRFWKEVRWHWQMYLEIHHFSSAGNWEVEPMVKAMSLRRSEIPRGHDLGRLRDVAVTFTWKKPLCSDNPRYLEVATSDDLDDFHI